LRSDFEKNIGNKVYFAFDSAILSQEAKDRLKKQAEWLVAHSNVIATIEGHCDERGSRNYNLALGLRRAEAAEKFLITQGIDQRRLTVVTYVKDKPEVEGHNKNAWRLNRRAVAIIIKAQ
jgi:peptidoglycan-associated lipoprotein